ILRAPVESSPWAVLSLVLGRNGIVRCLKIYIKKGSKKKSLGHTPYSPAQGRGLVERDKDMEERIEVMRGRETPAAQPASMAVGFSTTWHRIKNAPPLFNEIGAPSNGPFCECSYINA